MRFIRISALGGVLLILLPACADQQQSTIQNHTHHTETPAIVNVPDTREPIALDPTARAEHRAVMLQHLESLQQIVAALAQEDYERAQGLTENQLGFFMHRQAMLRQQAGAFPPKYHDLAFAHHEAAEELAQSMSSRDLKVVMPKLDKVLQACVACHLAYSVDESRRPTIP